MTESNECMVEKGDNQEPEGTAKCRRKKWRSIWYKSGGGGKAGKGPDRAREAWMSERGSKRSTQSDSTGQGGRSDERNPLCRKKRESNKSHDETKGTKESLHKLRLWSKGQWSIVRA